MGTAVYEHDKNPGCRCELLPEPLRIFFWKETDVQDKDLWIYFRSDCTGRCREELYIEIIAIACSVSSCLDGHVFGTYVCFENFVLSQRTKQKTSESHVQSKRQDDKTSGGTRVCFCVRGCIERERERERDRYIYIYIHIYIYILSAEDLGWMVRFVCRLCEHRTVSTCRIVCIGLCN